MLGLIFDASHFHVVNLALMDATSAVENAEVSERTRFGRELHDSISQLLLGARMSLEIASSLPQADVPNALTEIDSMIGAVQEEVRGLSFLLHPPALTERGLVTALDDLCAGLRLRLRLPVHFQADPELPTLPEAVQYALYRIVQEALVNVHQHACATRAEVLLLRVSENIELVVSDDGGGITELNHGQVPQGVGIASMKERMTRIGGSLELVNGCPGLTLIARVEAFAPKLSDD
jgi:signal transduction histidine kinase